MRLRSTFRWSSLALALPSLAGAQDAGLSSRVDPATLAAVQPVLSGATADSLPVASLEAKVLEGVAKGRPPAVIARVVGDLAESYRRTRTELRTGLPDQPLADGEVVAAAMARQQGVPLDVVMELWAARSDASSLEIPVTVLTELVRRGVPAQGAAALMTHVLETGVPLDRAAQIPAKLDGVSRPGMSPPDALTEALKVLHIAGPPPGRGNGPPDARGGGPPPKKPGGPPG